MLVDTANQLIEHYSNLTDLNNCRLIFVPCANPDGLLDGTTNNGFGRCNANGIDLNRDFDANYTPFSNSRNYTQSPFSAAESRALRDLYNEYKPDIVIDFHGWESSLIGDIEIKQPFNEELGLSVSHSFTSTNSNGYFSNWAHQQGSLAMLVEFTSFNSIDLTKLKNAINRLINNEYDNGEGEYQADPKYADFEDIKCYTLSNSRVTTYVSFDKPFSTPSYIDGQSDLCTINRIYANGWVKVTYPISSGEKTAYCKLSEFIAEAESVTPYTGKVSQNTDVYRRKDKAETIGSVWTTDTFTIVGKTENMVQIIYPLDSGGWKMGWIDMNCIN